MKPYKYPKAYSDTRRLLHLRHLRRFSFRFDYREHGRHQRRLGGPLCRLRQQQKDRKSRHGRIGTGNVYSLFLNPNKLQKTKSCYVTFALMHFAATASARQQGTQN
jgi:hypothetical protein